MRQPLAPLNLHPDADHRLFNWGRWARPRSLRGVSITGIICDRLARENSIFEGHPPRIEVDLRDALAIERAWQSLTDHKAKVLTRGHYVIGADHRDLCRAVHIPFRAWDQEITKAALILTNCAGRLTTGRIAGSIQLNSCISTSSCSVAG